MSPEARPLDEALLEKVLAHYPSIKRDAPRSLEPLRSGLIHQSFLLRIEAGADEPGGAQELLLQRVNPIFGEGVHENVRRVTDHLAQRGLVTPRVLTTAGGEASAMLEDGGRFRLMRFVPGRSFETCPGPSHARAAAGLVARFHGALVDFAAPLAPLGFPFHDTPRHLAELERAVAQHRGHPLHDEVASLARRVQEAAEAWEPFAAMPARLVHADLKFNNVLFAPEAGPDAPPEGRCLIDLDTLCRLPLWVELGDAWRSWCNRNGEDSAEAELDLGLFEASARGYLDAGALRLEAEERRALPHALERVALELAARFAADALEERYFGWDSGRYASAGEHNLVRARGQISLHDQARDARAEQARILG